MVVFKAAAGLVVNTGVAMPVYHSIANIEVQVSKAMCMHEGYMLGRYDRKQ